MEREPPIGDIETSVPVQEGLRRIVPEQSTDQSGSALESLGVAAQQAEHSLQTKDAASYVGAQMANLRVAAEQHLINNRDKSPDDIQNAGGYMPAVMKDFQASAQDAIKNAPNPIAKSLMQHGVQNLGAETQIRAMKMEAADRLAARAATAQDSITKAATAVELNPQSWQSAGAEQHLSIQNLGLEPEDTLKLSRESDQQISLSAARGFAKQDPNGTLKRLDDPKDDLMSGLQLQQREAIRSIAQNQQAQQIGDPIVDTFRTQGPSAGGKALSTIDQLPDEERARVYSHVQQGISQWHEEARNAHADAIEGLEQRFAANKTTPGDRGVIWSLYHNGSFDATQTGESLGRLEKAQEKQLVDNAGLMTAQAAYTQGMALDPKDKDSRAGVNQFFNNMTAHVPTGSAEWINRGADIAAKTGITPDYVIDWARTQLSGGDEKSAAAAAIAVMRQQEANPRGLGYAIDDKTKAMAKQINDAVIAGTDPIAAVKMARANSSMPDAERMRLQKLYQTQRVANNSAGALAQEIKTLPGYDQGFFSKNPDIPPDMQGQFQQLQSDYFKLFNGNLPQANQQAMNDLKNTWGITRINGKPELMQFAPEAMNPGLTTEALRADMTKAAKGHTDDPSKATLVPIDETYTTGGQKFGLSVPDKFGMADVIRDAKGHPIPYVIPNAQIVMADNIQKANTVGMQRLHAQQAHARESEKAEWDAIKGAEEQRQRFASSEIN